MWTHARVMSESAVKVMRVSSSAVGILYRVFCKESRKPAGSDRDGSPNFHWHPNRCDADWEYWCNLIQWYYVIIMWYSILRIPFWCRKLPDLVHFCCWTGCQGDDQHHKVRWGNCSWGIGSVGLTRSVPGCHVSQLCQICIAISAGEFDRSLSHSGTIRNREGKALWTHLNNFKQFIYIF